ncbi:MAG: LPS export ABC transporter periplasmic protein LptC [Thioalkalivibrio sp.]|nr:MAG: LPS export ABC transporter periplasmic protein LptC [Thioalkalivibrio sp.]
MSRPDAAPPPPAAGGPPRLLRPAALILAVAAALAPAPPAALESGADFDLIGFTLRVTDAEGEITHVLRGARMQQFPDLGVQHAQEPRLELLTEGRVDWIWTAPAAVHYPAEERLETIGMTEGLQLPGPLNPRTEIETADVTILTGPREVMTDARATLLRPGLFMTGIGMHADVKADIIELRNEVETVYAPEETGEDPQ